MIVAPTGALALHLSAAGFTVVPAAPLHQDEGMEAIAKKLRPFLDFGHPGLIHVSEELVESVSN